MKFSLEWHEKAMANATASLEREEDAMARMASRIKANRAAVEFYARQIDEARRRGVNEFDPERFMKANPKKAMANE